MTIIVTNPIVRPHRTTRHTGGHSGGHARAPKPHHTPAPHHVRAPKPPHAPKPSHLKGVHHDVGGSSAIASAATPAQSAGLEASLLAQQNADAQAANHAAAGTSAQNLAGSGTPYTGAYGPDGRPTGKPPGKGINIGRIPVATLKPTPATTRHTAGGSNAGRTHAPPRTHTLRGTGAHKVTAPLQLTDAGLRGHDSHVTAPQALSPIAPVTVRRPH